ncbi:MAG: hypothetical protein ABJC89_06125 [Acidobacteriota bacterium]
MRNATLVLAWRGRFSWPMLPALTIATCFWASCRYDPGPPAASTPRTLVTGAEQLEWEQSPLEDTDPLTYTFVAYVDHVRKELPGVTCRVQPPGKVYRCTAPLPVLTPGRHLIRLATISKVHSQARESAPSTLLELHQE